MYKEEAIVKIIDKLQVVYADINQQQVRSILDEVLYDYELSPATTALVISNNVLNKILVYLASKRLDGLSNLTIECYKQHLNRFALFMQKNIEDINAMDIRMYLAAYAKTGVKNTTLATEISVLKSFFSWLENEEYLHRSPMRKIKNVKTEKRLRKALNVEELELLREACKTYRERALIEFLYSTGCRLDELVKLNKGDIDWQNLTVLVVGKGDKERPVYISLKAKVHIQKYLMSRLDDSEALFVTERKPHKRLGRRSIEREVAKIGKRAGIGKDVYPHLIRHTTATTLLNNGADLATVQQILGHEDPATTQIYAKLSKENVQHEYRKHMIQ